MTGKYSFFHKIQGSSQTHVWSEDQKRTLCGFSKSLQEHVVSKWGVFSTPGDNICHICYEKLSSIVEKSERKKGPKKAPVRPEEIEYLKRWKGATSHPSFFEKMDRDPAYNRTVKRKYSDIPFYYDKAPSKKS